MRKKPKAEKTPEEYRSYHHMNSNRLIEDRYEEDREEALQYSESFSTNRKGKNGAKYPDIDSYDESQGFTTSRSNKYPVKPKKNDKKGKDSIRKPPDGALDARD